MNVLGKSGGGRSICGVEKKDGMNVRCPDLPCRLLQAQNEVSVVTNQPLYLVQCHFVVESVYLVSDVPFNVCSGVLARAQWVFVTTLFTLRIEGVIDIRMPPDGAWPLRLAALAYKPKSTAVENVLTFLGIAANIIHTTLSIRNVYNFNGV